MQHDGKSPATMACQSFFEHLVKSTFSAIKPLSHLRKHRGGDADGDLIYLPGGPRPSATFVSGGRQMFLGRGWKGDGCFPPKHDRHLGLPWRVLDEKRPGVVSLEAQHRHIFTESV